MWKQNEPPKKNSSVRWELLLFHIMAKAKFYFYFLWYKIQINVKIEVANN